MESLSPDNIQITFSAPYFVAGQYLTGTVTLNVHERYAPCTIQLKLEGITKTIVYSNDNGNTYYDVDHQFANAQIKYFKGMANLLLQYNCYLDNYNHEGESNLIDTELRLYNFPKGIDIGSYKFDFSIKIDRN